jgi:hypothetical protein
VLFNPSWPHAFGLAPFTFQAALLQTAHIAFHISTAACNWFGNCQLEMGAREVLQTSAYIAHQCLFVPPLSLHFFDAVCGKKKETT